jgi:Ankyrin repeat
MACCCCNNNNNSLLLELQEVLELLVSRGADGSALIALDLGDEDGMTPLHYAAKGRAPRDIMELFCRVRKLPPIFWDSLYTSNILHRCTALVYRTSVVW